MAKIVMQIVIGVGGGATDSLDVKTLAWQKSELSLHREKVLEWLTNYPLVYLTTIHDDGLAPMVQRMVKTDTWKFA